MQAKKPSKVEGEVAEALKQQLHSLKLMGHEFDSDFTAKMLAQYVVAFAQQVKDGNIKLEE